MYETPPSRTSAPAAPVQTSLRPSAASAACRYTAPARCPYCFRHWSPSKSCRKYAPALFPEGYCRCFLRLPAHNLPLRNKTARLFFHLNISPHFPSDYAAPQHSGQNPPAAYSPESVPAKTAYAAAGASLCNKRLSFPPAAINKTAPR